MTAAQELAAKRWAKKGARKKQSAMTAARHAALTPEERSRRAKVAADKIPPHKRRERARLAALARHGSPNVGKKSQNGTKRRVVKKRPSP